MDVECVSACYTVLINLTLMGILNAQGSRPRLPEVLQVSLLSQPSTQTAVGSGQDVARIVR
jgi:hypothetical protein